MAELQRRGSRTNSGASTASDPCGHLDISDALAAAGDAADGDAADSDSDTHSLARLAPPQTHGGDGDGGGGGGVRWWVLALACMLMFGNFYAYDLPAALNKPLQAYLNATDETYQYQLNLLYSLYSLPNIILPFFGGYLVDRFGTRRLMTILSTLVCLGQLMFTFGVIYRNYVLMQFGRVVFGLGGETLSVAQTRITTKWFKGKELAFALGVNLSVSRLGTVLTDFLSPHLAIGGSVPSAIWAGFITCVISLLCGVALNAVDEYGTNAAQDAFASTYELIERRPRRHAKKSFDNTSRKRSQSRSRPSLSRMESSASQEPLFMSPSASESQQNHISPPRLSFKDVLDFPLAFWQIVLVMCLMFATVIPFNTIHAAFLQLKWYHGNPKKAAQVMAIPDIISAILVPFVGTFVDKFGRRSMVLLVCGVSMAIVHLVLGFVSVEILTSPIPALAVLGFSYSLLLTFWPCIPLVVPEKRVATAFGLATSAQNLALTVFPLIVAWLVNTDPTYRLTEFFFFSVSVLGSLVCVWMHWYDRVYLSSVLDLPTGFSRRPE